MRQAAELGDRLYEQHGRPLEAEHWGKYLAVHPDGRTILEDDYNVLTERAPAELGEDVHVFKVGPKATHTWTGFRRISENQND